MAAPKWPTNRIVEVGNRALELHGEYGSDLVERLPPGTVDGLTADVAAFQGKLSEAKRAPQELRALTSDVRKATAGGHAFVIATREAIIRAGVAASVRKAFGVGLRMRSTSVPDVRAGLDAVVTGAAAHPEVARAAGLLEADVAQARTLSAAIAGADEVQERKKEARKTPTAQRAEVARRIEKAVDAIVGVALIRFYAQPAIANRFRALIPSRGRKTPAAPAPGTPS